MKILFSSHAFAPMLGGIESISAVLASEFVKAGHQVTVITQTPGESDCSLPYEVVRRPSPFEVTRLARWCDVFFQNNVSLRFIFAALPAIPRLVIAYQTWIRRTDGRSSIQHWIKSRVSLVAKRNVAISRAIEISIPGRCILIPNPYDHAIYRKIDGIERKPDLVFVGRLVSDKGVDILINALGRLNLRGIVPRLTIVGSGPEESSLRRQATEACASGQVVFAGSLRGEELAHELNGHSVLVVPSRWAEPFGVVALEGIACGCVVIGSASGGLPDAIGDCGYLFPNGDDHALADLIDRVIGSPELKERCLRGASNHLVKHRGDAIAGRYLELFSEVLS